MWHTSGCLLQKGLDDQKGSFHQFMASLVFTAFTLEASLNHIGQKVFNCWNDLENLTPKKKLSIISEKLDVKINYAEKPWQVMQEIFKFRNYIAHGKSESINTTVEMPLHKFSDKKFGELLETNWMEYCTQQNAERAREDVEKIVKILYAAGSFENDFPFASGLQHGSATYSE